MADNIKKLPTKRYESRPAADVAEGATIERLPSANVHIEAKLLGYLLYDSQLLPLVRERLAFPPDMRVRPFYREAHQLLYEDICTHYDAGDVPEIETIRNDLEASGKLEQVGGESALWELINRTTDETALNLDAARRERILLQWADRLRDHALRRATIDIFTSLAGIGYPDPQTAEVDPQQDLEVLKEKITRLAESAKTNASRYQPLTVDQLLDLPDQEYLINGVLPQDSISMIYGEPGSCKSFLTLDMALCTAAGIPWHGHTSKQGPVVYIAAEGGRGIKQRVRVWLDYHQCSHDLPFYIIDRAVPLLQPESVHELLAAIRALPLPPALIFIDTLARSMDGGDENAAKDVNTVTAAADRIRQLHGAHVCIVHHSGKDGSRGARGSSALRGNVDTEIVVSKDQNTITVKCEKQKEDEQFQAFTLTARRIALDEYATKTSLVLVDAPNAPMPERVILKDNRQRALDALAAFQNGATATEWERVSGLANRTFYRVREELEEKRLIVKKSEDNRDYYKLTEYGLTLTATAK